MTPHEIKSLVDDAAAALNEAVDVDDALWAARMTGQDSSEAEDSGYLVGYRDALNAVQSLVGHSDARFLLEYVEAVRGETREALDEIAA